MTDPTRDERLERIERGLDAIFATEVAREILEAVDFEAILADEPADDPVDVDRLADAVGRPVGRFLAQRVIGGSGAGGVAKRAVGSEVGGRVAGAALRTAAEYVDTERATERLVELDEMVLPGPSLRDAVDPGDDGTAIEPRDRD